MKKYSYIILIIITFILFTPKIFADDVMDQYSDITWQIDDGEYTCEEVLGPNVTNLLKGLINTLRLIGAIICLVNAMIILIPPIASGDASALKKAGKKCVNLAIVLVIIGILPSFVYLIGDITGFDTTCIL